jgi:hypothetical protein
MDKGAAVEQRMTDGRRRRGIRKVGAKSMLIGVQESFSIILLNFSHPPIEVVRVQIDMK